MTAAARSCALLWKLIHQESASTEQRLATAQDLTSRLRHLSAIGIATASAAATPSRRGGSADGPPDVRITFLSDGVYIDGRLAAGSPADHEVALRLATWMRSRQVGEILATTETTAKDVMGLVDTLQRQPDDPGASRKALQALAGVTVSQRLVPTNASSRGRLLSRYAELIAVSRALYRDVAAGQRPSVPAVKRTAQELVELVERAGAMTFGFTTMLEQSPDPATFGVQSAMLAVLLAHQLGVSRRARMRLAMAAVLADATEHRLAAAEGGELPDAWYPYLGALAATEWVAMTGSARREADLVIRAFEVLKSEHDGRTSASLPEALPERHDPIGDGRGAQVSSEVILTARALVRACLPGKDGQRRSPPDALEALDADPRTNPTLHARLVSAVGDLPCGTVVALTSGEWAVVSGLPRPPGAPPLLVVTDTGGRALETPEPLVLPLGGERRIRAVVPARFARFNVAAALFSADAA